MVYLYVGDSNPLVPTTLAALAAGKKITPGSATEKVAVIACEAVDLLGDLPPPKGPRRCPEHTSHSSSAGAGVTHYSHSSG